MWAMCIMACWQTFLYFCRAFANLQPELVVDFPARFTDLEDKVKCLLLFPRNAKCPPHPFPVLLFASCFPSSPCFLSCPFPLSPVLWIPVILLLLVLLFPWHSLFFSSLTLPLPLLFLASQLISHPPALSPMTILTGSLLHCQIC